MVLIGWSGELGPLFIDVTWGAGESKEEEEGVMM
jgi:hypothetical protein